MADPTSGDHPGSSGRPSPIARKRWYQRPSIRALRKEAEQDTAITRSFDDRENEDSRLPEEEEIHLGGLVLTEAFTPSTVSSLYHALEDWPANRPGEKRDRLEQLERSRGGDHGGWQNLGVVRRPGAFLMGTGHNDPDLPEGVDAVWLHVSYVTPTLAMVVATFTLKEEGGDLSPLLRRDYQTQHFNVRVRVYGRFGNLRARIPWARPISHAAGFSVSSPDDQKRKACRALIREREDACGRWFSQRFPGRFAVAESERRPVIRMLFTKEQVPYAERLAWLAPVGLDFAAPLWRSVQPQGWWLAEERWPHENGRHAMTLSARRRDAVREGPGAPPTNPDSNWYLTQRFGSEQAPLAARHAIVALVSLYAHELGRLRDEAGIKRFPRRPVREGQKLDDYLVRDGLDASTFTADLDSLTSDLIRFRWNVPEFVEVLDHLPPPLRNRQPDEYVPALCSFSREQAARLASDTDKTVGNIKASAELRQAIANTRLQRVIIVLSITAVVVALLSLLAAKS